MGLLHKNLILAGIASVAMVGLLSPSSVSALDGFSFSDIINQQQAQREQLLSHLTNPFSTSTACESTDPDSTISCNESSFPNLLFNRISDGEKLWGHDGKGIIFADSENLINGNPQLKTAKRGNTLTFSVQLEAEDYYDAAETDSIREYEIVALLSKGLTLDQSSISVKIGDQELAQDQYELFHQDGASMGSASQDFSAMVGPEISIDGSLGQLAGKTIELSLSATIDQDAPSEVFVRSVYGFDHQGGFEISEPDYMSNETYQAAALLDGNILIRRVDADGNPLAGAKYTVDGMKANVEDEANNIYVYDENGSVAEFTTDSEGKVIIKNAPMGEHTVREVQAPQGHETNEPVITSPIYENNSEFEYGRSYMMDYFGMATIDITDLIEDISGTKVLETGNMLSRVDEALGASDATVEKNLAFARPIFTFDESSNTYKRTGLANYIEKDGDGYRSYHSNSPDNIFTYDENMDKYVATVSLSDSDSGLSGWYLDFDGPNVSVRLPDNDISGTTINLSYDESDECYHGYTVFNNNSYATKLCQNSFGYSLYIDSDILLIPQLMHFEYDEEAGKYMAADNIVGINVLEELSDSEVQIFSYYPIIYDEQQGQYYISLGSLGFRRLDVSRQSILASEFLFQDKTSDDAPEDIANPQTGDAVIKIVLITLAGIVPVMITSKKFGRR